MEEGLRPGAVGGAPPPTSGSDRFSATAEQASRLRVWSWWARLQIGPIPTVYGSMNSPGPSIEPGGEMRPAPFRRRTFRPLREPDAGTAKLQFGSVAFSRPKEQVSGPTDVESESRNVGGGSGPVEGARNIEVVAPGTPDDTRRFRTGRGIAPPRFFGLARKAGPVVGGASC